MIIDRPIEHAIMPTFFQTHAIEKDLASPADIDMFLRVSALHCRSLVFVDSDLNGSELFHAVASHDKGVFWRGLSTGFIRRAARVGADGSPVSQATVAEGLRKVNPGRAARMPAEYLRNVSAFCDRVEMDAPPLTWSRADVDKYSLGRLQAFFRSAVEGNALPPSHALFDRVWDTINHNLDAGNPFGAADIEQQFRPPDHEDSEEWQLIWRLTLQAQPGNIPFVYRGQLAITTTPRSGDKLLPAGPESKGVEVEVESDIYLDPRGKDGGIEVSTRKASDSDSASPVEFVLNTERLAALRLEEIEDLREESLGGDFFQTRFDATGSGTDMLEALEPYSTSLLEYHERLHRAGLLRTRRLDRAAIRETLRQVIVTAEKHEETVQILMQSSSPLPVAEHNIVMCDSRTIYEALGPVEARKILPDENALWLYRRPDYRVLERLG